MVNISETFLRNIAKPFETFRNLSKPFEIYRRIKLKLSEIFLRQQIFENWFSKISCL